MEKSDECVKENDVVQDERNSDKGDDRELPAWMLRAAREQLDDEDEHAVARVNRDEETNAIVVDDRSSPVRNSQRDRQEAPGNLQASANVASRREPCMYAERCYRKNPAHRAEYSHPGDDDYTPPKAETGTDGDNKPECQYGTACYRKNPKHRREFKHTRPPQNSDDEPTAKPPAKRRRRRADDDEYESGGENEYDLNDPFIDDSEQEDSESDDDDDDDEDYEPQNNDIDPELLNEEQWRAAADDDDDAPEVLQLLKDARDYLRNKKMQK